MAKKVDDQDSELQWRIKELDSMMAFAGYTLEVIWMYLQGKTDHADFGGFFDTYGQTVHLLDGIRREPLTTQEEKDKVRALRMEGAEIAGTHDALYEAESQRLTEELKKACEGHINFFEHLDMAVGKSLNVPEIDERCNDDYMDHPIIGLLEKRDRIGYIILGIRIWQLDDQYWDVDVDEYERRLKIADLTLKKKILECVNYYYKDYHEAMPYAPEDFWWRRIKGHEFQG